ncbi:hypothetical protein LCGC14_0009630, partial [marine sediment metagenome]
MSCHRTADIVADYFDARLSPPARLAVQQHVSTCTDCRAEVAALAPAHELLLSWQQQPVPEWDRSHGPAAHQPRQPLVRRRPRPTWGHVGRWLPLAASLVLSVAVLTQTRLDVSAQGWQLSFGTSAAERQLQQLDGYLAEQARVQQQENQQMLEAAKNKDGYIIAYCEWRPVDKFGFFEKEGKFIFEGFAAGNDFDLQNDIISDEALKKSISDFKKEGKFCINHKGKKILYAFNKQTRKVISTQPEKIGKINEFYETVRDEQILEKL